MKHTTTLTLLLTFTALAALAFSYLQGGPFLACLILLLAVLKFLLVAFQFMELRKAHQFWQTAMALFSIMFLVVFCGLALR
jgi:hypothetical protein